MIEKVTRLTVEFLLVGLLSFPLYAKPQATSSQPTSPQTTDTQPPAASPQTTDQQPPATDTTDTTDTKKTKPKKLPTNGNVDDIGTRDINKHDLDFFSIDKEIQIGRQLSAEVERQVKLQNDPIIGEYVNRVGQTIVRNSDCKVPFTIKVVQSDEINAFALPGGFFYVNTGLINAADNEAELAAVMGHETAHVCARHGTKNQSKAELAQFLYIPLIMLGGPAGMAIRQSAGLIVPLSFLKFSRNDEAEADYLGLQYMYKAGYDPSAFVSMFEKLQAKESARANGVSPMFATHPATTERIAQTKKNIETILPDRDQYVVTTSEFDDIKNRLAMVENRKPNEDDPNSGKPSLIKNRTTGSGRTSPNDTGTSSGSRGGNNGSSGSTSDDDRPVLRRRDGGDTGTSSPSGTDTNSGTSSVPPPTETTAGQPTTTNPDSSNTTTQPSSDPGDDTAPPVLIRKPGAGGPPPQF
jgi:hypothetical protein